LLVSWLVEVKGKAKIIKENDLSQEVVLHAAVQVHPDTFSIGQLKKNTTEEYEKTTAA
jgi:hypothetical protein